MPNLTHLRVLEPHPQILAFYDGRVEGFSFADYPNWVDDGALSLGIASYAIINGADAVVYDTHVSIAHAEFIQQTLQQRGVKNITVILSHWHLDHVAGTEVFAACSIIANRRTMKHLLEHKVAIENGTHHGPPAINPLVLPDRLFEGQMTFMLGDLKLQLIEANIHSDDATVIWIEQLGILLAGDTMEDTVTYVGEPEAFDMHLADLDKLYALDPTFILPNHGDPDVIARGGYDKGFIKATQQYIRVLKRSGGDEGLRKQPLAELIAGPLGQGWVHMFEPYEAIHQQNIIRVLKMVQQ